MADKQPQLFTPPPGYYNSQQPHQIPKELLVDLDPLLARLPRIFLLADLRLVQGCLFLLGDGIVDATEEGDEETEVDGARCGGAVAQVEV